MKFGYALSYSTVVDRSPRTKILIISSPHSTEVKKSSILVHLLKKHIVSKICKFSQKLKNDPKLFFHPNVTLFGVKYPWTKESSQTTFQLNISNQFWDLDRKLKLPKNWKWGKYRFSPAPLASPQYWDSAKVNCWLCLWARAKAESRCENRN